MIPKWRGTKEPLDEGEKGEWKSWLKLNIQKKKKTLNIQKLKIMASSSITLWQIGKKWKQWQIFFLGF